MSSNEQDQLCVVDSDTGQILYYFIPSTGEMKWVNQPPKEIELSKQIPPKVQSRATSDYDTEELLQSARQDNPEENTAPSPDHNNHDQTQIEPKECSNFISGEVVTVLLEPCPDSGKKIKASSSVARGSHGEMAKATWNQDLTDKESSLGVGGNGRRKNVSRKRKPSCEDPPYSPSKKSSLDLRKPSSTSLPVTTMFKCKYCEKEFTNKQRFVLHLQGHQGVHACPRCSRGFLDADDLAAHVSIHVLAKPFMCGQCDKTFTNEGNLAIHLAIHEGIKPYRCQFCSTSFTHAKALTLHLANHVGLKPCRCNFCQRSFDNPKELSSHVLIHGAAERVKNKNSKRDRVTLTCKLCTEFFTDQQSLEIHVVECHQRIKASGAPGNVNPLKQLQALIYKETSTFQSSHLNKMRESRPFTRENDKISTQSREKGLKHLLRFTVPRRQEDASICNPLKQLHALTYRRESPVNETSLGTTLNVNEPRTSGYGRDRYNGNTAAVKSGADRFEKPISENELTESQGRERSFKQEDERTGMCLGASEVPCEGNESDTKSPRGIRCHQCSNTFSSPNDLVIHACVHHADVKEVHRCLKCRHVFGRECELKKHLRTHESKQIYKCPKCSKTFIHSHGLNLHLRIHTGEKPFHCQHCSKAFAHSGNLTVHLRTHTGEKPYQCEFCQQAFNHSSNLKNHMRLHTGEKPYRCKHCDRLFSRSSHLRNHVINHILGKSDAHLYKCDVCDRSFEDLAVLTEHLKTHSDTRPHLCQYCGKAFSVPSGLAVHLRTHTGEKPYKCGHCERAFSHSSNLKVHIRTHTGEKPYHCNSCNTTFARSSDLRRHVYFQGCHKKSKATTVRGGKPVGKTEHEMKFTTSGSRSKVSGRSSNETAYLQSPVQDQPQQVPGNAESEYLAQEKSESQRQQYEVKDQLQDRQPLPTARTSSQASPKRRVVESVSRRKSTVTEADQGNLVLEERISLNSTPAQGTSSLNSPLRRDNSTGHILQFPNTSSNGEVCTSDEDKERITRHSPVERQSQPSALLLSTLALKPTRSRDTHMAIQPPPERYSDAHKSVEINDDSDTQSLPMRSKDSSAFNQKHGNLNSALRACDPTESNVIENVKRSHPLQMLPNEQPVMETSSLQPLQALTESIQF